MDAKLSVIVFSKDRPWQLKECLRTIALFVPHTDIHVLYRGGDEYEELKWSYRHVFFHKETNFADDLLLILNTIDKTNYIMFCVDDIIFYNHVPVAHGLSIMGDQYWGWHTKLYNQIYMCHPAQKSHGVPNITDQGNNVGMYTLGEQPLEWSYPWCLSGTIYHRRVVIGMINSIYRVFGLPGISHPNKLEANGYTLMLQSGINGIPMLCMYDRPVMSIITVNRVQDHYDNPIYDTDVVFPTSELDSMEYDIGYYQKQKYNSVHIGDVHIINRKTT